MFAHLQRIAHAIEEKPGVYLMKDQEGKVLYVGKAKKLKTRLLQYINMTDSRLQIPYLLEKVQDIETIVVPSELEALLLENNLIKKHQPKYNVLFKDDKTYTCLYVNTEHDFATVNTIRAKNAAKKKGLAFGPYTSSYVAKETRQLLFELFHLRQCSDFEFTRRSRPCVLHGLKLCDAPCVGLISKKEYQDKVDQAIQFLKGNNKEMIQYLEDKRDQASKKMEYEKAGLFQKQIESILRFFQKQSVQNISKQDMDAVGFARYQNKAMITVLSFEKGKLLESNNYFFEIAVEEDQKLLERYLVERYILECQHEKTVLLPFLRSSLDTIQGFFEEGLGFKVKFMIPKKGTKLDLVTMAHQNAEASLKKQIAVDKIQEKSLASLQEKLQLVHFPNHIECIDPSHLSGSENVAALTTFINGKKSTSHYRKYKLKTPGGDDYGSIREVIQRRFSKVNPDHIPDLLMIDGGKGQLSVASEALHELDLVHIDLIAIAKEKSKHTKGTTQETIYRNDHKEPVILDRRDEALFLLQRIRDETHRFAIAYQKQRRKKTLIKTKLDEIPTIGPKKRKLLLDHFGSVNNLKKASREDLLKIEGLSERNIDYIIDFIRTNPQ